MTYLLSRSSDTLLPIIERKINPGSIVRSDMWAAYNGIAEIEVDPPFVVSIVITHIPLL